MKDLIELGGYVTTLEGCISEWKVPCGCRNISKRDLSKANIQMRDDRSGADRQRNKQIDNFFNSCREDGFEPCMEPANNLPTVVRDAIRYAQEIFPVYDKGFLNRPSVAYAPLATVISYRGDSARALIFGESGGPMHNGMAPAATLVSPHQPNGLRLSFEMPAYEGLPDPAGTIVEMLEGFGGTVNSLMLSEETVSTALLRFDRIARAINLRSGEDPSRPVLSVAFPSLVLALILREVREQEPQFLGIYRLERRGSWQFEIGVVSLPHLNDRKLAAVNCAQASTHRVRLSHDDFGVLRAEWLGSVQS